MRLDEASSWSLLQYRMLLDSPVPSLFVRDSFVLSLVVGFRRFRLSQRVSKRREWVCPFSRLLEH